MNTTDLEQAREEEIVRVLQLAVRHDVNLDWDDITFAEGGHYPYIDGMDAEDWIEAQAME